MHRIHALLSLSLALCLAPSGNAFADDGMRLRGAGSSAAHPVYATWASAYAAQRGVQLDYDPAGSGAGIRKVLAGEADFGASDLVPDAETLAGRDMVVVPTAVTGAVPVLNLPGIATGRLRLDGATLADIFAGRIQRWNDAALRALNPGLDLPDRPIRRVVRSDSSGTTWNFSDYLAKASPSWQAEFGVASRFDWKGEVIAARGSSGVTEAVQRTPGAIAYVDYNYVVRHNLDAIALRNRDGAFVSASLDSFSAALEASPWPRSGDFSSTLTNQPGLRSWPITMGTFIIVPRHSNAPGVRHAVEFFTWAFMHGDALIRNSHFVRLPDRVQAKAFQSLSAVTDAGGRAIAYAGLSSR
jgi:phosphate transport system substrate-binding protein